MKKLLMLMVCCFVAMPAFAADNCPANNELELQGTQNGKDNEFVYTNQSVYDEVVDCYSKFKAGANKKKCSLKKGSVYECDRQQGCSHGVYLMGESGWIHGGDGEDVEDKILMCSSPAILGDSWKRVSMQQECPQDVDLTWTRIQFKNSTDKKCYRGYVGGEIYCCKSASQSACEDDDKGIWNGTTCQCGGTEKGAEASGLWKWDGSKCVESGASCDDGTPDGGKQLYMGKAGNCNSQEAMGEKGENVEQCTRKCENGKWTEWTIIKCKDGYNHDGNKCVKKDSEQKACRETRLTNAGKACCDTSYANNWDEKTQTCSCGNGEKFEVYDTNRGRCVKVLDNNDNNDNNDNVVTQEYKCPELHLSVVDNCPEYTIKFQELTSYCGDQNPTQDVYVAKVAELNSIIANCSQKPVVNVDDIRGRIVSNGGNIAKLVNGWRDSLTVWKTKEGDFNTKRLASDSIAGVVLGTAGGLITSKVVKKNQVKSGFEDVQCTIGGQKVADWHDEFTVGVQ